MNEEQRLGVLYGVGVGPGDPGMLTVRAVEVLREVKVIFNVVGPRSRESISEQIVDSVSGCHARHEQLVFSMSNDAVVREQSVSDAAVRVVEVLRDGLDCAFTTIGDPLIYSTFSYLQKVVRELLPDVEIRVIPGITSFQAAAAAWGEPLVEDNEVLTIIPKWLDDEQREAAMGAADTAVLLKTYRQREDAVGAAKSHMPNADLFYAARVGLADQVVKTNLEDITSQPIDYLSLLIAKRGSCD